MSGVPGCGLPPPALDRGRWAGLPAAEQALLWAMRAWVIGQVYSIEVEGRIRSVLATICSEHAYGYLDGFMWVVSNGAVRRIDTNCVCEPYVTADERVLLDVFGLHQHEARRGACAPLRTMLTSPGADAAEDSAWRLAALFEQAGQRTTLH